MGVRGVVDENIIGAPRKKIKINSKNSGIRDSRIGEGRRIESK